MTAVTLHLAALCVDDRELARCRRLIAPDEQAQASRFRFGCDRRRFVVRRARLRLLLAAETGLAAEELAFVANPHGKPGLPGGPHFSLSHSGDRMLLAIADREVGCDLEQVRDMADWRAVAATLFSPAERTAFAAMPEAAGRQAFFDCWARKEAFVKALGWGLSYPLDAFDVSLGTRAHVTRGGVGWRMAAVPGIPGHAAAVVARDDGEPLALFGPAAA